MQYNEIIAMMKEVSKLGMSSFTFTEGDIHISMNFPEGKEEIGGHAVMQNGSQSVSAGNTAVLPEQPEARKGTPITSPLVGTFYASPEENGEPFVQVGDRVKKGQTIGIVEAMKLMNEIESDVDGIVTAIPVKNAQVVEYGQVLAVIEAD